MPSWSLFCDPKGSGEVIACETEVNLDQETAAVSPGVPSSKSDRRTVGAPPEAPGSDDGLHRIPSCAICLETSNPSMKVMLSCGHVFCWTCISQYVKKEQEETRVAACPQCKKPLQKHELEICMSSDAAGKLIVDAASRVATSDCRQGCADQFAEVEILAEAVPEMKLCPACHAPIQKNGGCDHMTCRCGHEFFWSQVPSVAPCADPHEGHCRPGSPAALWGATCPNCSWKAVGKLAARRAGLVIGGTVAGAVAVPFVLVGGTLVLVAAGACSLHKAVQSRLPAVAATNLSEARNSERLAHHCVLAAEKNLKEEQQRWFNQAGIAAAEKRLAATQVLWQEAKEAVQELEAAQGAPRAYGQVDVVDGSSMMQLCGPCQGCSAWGAGR